MNGTHLAGHHANAIGQTPTQCKVDEIRAKCADHHNPQDGAQLGKRAAQKLIGNAKHGIYHEDYKK